MKVLSSLSGSHGLVIQHRPRSYLENRGVLLSGALSSCLLKQQTFIEAKWGALSDCITKFKTRIYGYWTM